MTPTTRLAPSGGSTPHGAGGFVLCSFPEICLAVPQSEVASIEHGTAVAEARDSAVAWFESARGPWPVCALDSQLRPRPASQGEDSFLVFLDADPIPVGLRCESVRVVRSGFELNVHTVPAVMRASGSEIIQGVVRVDRSHLVLVLGKNRLSAYLTHCVAHERCRE